MKLILLAAFLPTAALSIQPSDSVATEKIKIRAGRLTEPISLDGILSESVWQNGNAVTTFYQRDPNEGKPASGRTEVRIAFDDNALYIGGRMYDNDPESIIARLALRDTQNNSDELVGYIDPYYDRRSGFYFGVNAGGTLLDGVLYNDEWNDDSWMESGRGRLTSMIGDGRLRREFLSHNYDLSARLSTLGE